MRTHRVAGHVELLAQFALGRIGHERRIRRIVESEEPAFPCFSIPAFRFDLRPFSLCLFPCQCRSLAGGVGQSVQLGLVGDVEREGFVLFQQVLRKLQTEHRGLLRQLAQSLLARLVQQGARAHKAFVAVVQEPLLFRSQSAVVQVYVAYALKQARVQSYVVRMLRQHGLHPLRQSIHVVISLCRQQVEEHRRHPAQQVVVALVLLSVDDGIVESRLLGIVDDFLYLFVVTADTLHEGLLEVLQSDAVEGHRVVRCAVRLKKRVHSHSNCQLSIMSYQLSTCKISDYP